MRIYYSQVWLGTNYWKRRYKFPKFTSFKNQKIKKRIKFFNFNLKLLNSTNIIKGKRVQYNLNKTLKFKIKNNKFKVRKISRKNFFQVSKQLKLDLNKRFRNSKKHFFRNSFGLCMQKDSKFIAACYSCANYEKQREVDIVTLERFRKLGLAKILAYRFILDCKRKGLEPKWDCYKDNFASNKLALLLGFKYILKPYNFIIVST